MTAIKNLVIEQGRTFSQVLRWEAQPIIYKAIRAITQTAPVQIVSPGHGIPDGWRAAVVSVKGMVQINAENNPPSVSDYRAVTVVDGDTVEFNEVNAADFSTYSGGGYLQFNTPVDLTGMTARMKIKDRTGVLLASTEAGDAPLNIIVVAVDATARTITASIAATHTAAIVWDDGVYDLEMVSGDTVTALMEGSVAVVREVTT